MTPQEKANHLVSIHSLTVLSKIGHKLPMEEVKEIAKATSLLEVNGIIEANPIKFDEDDNCIAKQWWQEVKKELEI